MKKNIFGNPWVFCCEPSDCQNQDKENAMIMAIHQQNISNKQRHLSPRPENKARPTKATLRRNTLKTQNNEVAYRKMDNRASNQFASVVRSHQLNHSSNVVASSTMSRLHSPLPLRTNTIRSPYKSPNHSPRVKFTYRSPEREHLQDINNVVKGEFKQKLQTEGCEKNRSSLIDVLLSCAEHSRTVSGNDKLAEQSEWKNIEAKGTTKLSYRNGSSRQSELIFEDLQQNGKQLRFWEDVSIKTYTKNSLISVKQEKSIDASSEASDVSRFSCTVQAVQKSKLQSSQHGLSLFKKKTVASIKVLGDYKANNIRNSKKHQTEYAPREDRGFRFKTVETISSDNQTINDLSTVDLKFTEAFKAINGCPEWNDPI